MAKNYKSIVEQALANVKKKASLTEGFQYPEGLEERMHPDLEKEAKEQKHSLGKHPCFPEGDERSFEEILLGERFSEVTKRYKRVHEIGAVDNGKAIRDLMPLVKDSMNIEHKHRKELEKLAEKMIREEYDMDEEVVEIHCELTAKISLEGAQKNASPVTIKEMQFDNHDQMVEANEEVYKRRFLNAMVQGAAKKCNQMFHMADNELSDIDPRLPSKYARMMATADLSYYIIPKMDNGISGGVVRVQFPTKDNPKAVIFAQAMVFPVLIHELVKGVMELLAAHGLPKNKKVAQFVINKADFISAEPWDMRLGPALWDRFTKLIDENDFQLKHHIFADLAALPVKEFNKQMKEILAGTKEGQKIVKELTEKIKSELQEDDFNEAMGVVDEASSDDGDDTFGWDEIESLF